MPIATIINGESGLSVRNKLNALISGFNTLSTQSNYAHILNSSGVQLPQRTQLEFNAGFTISDDPSDGITNVFIDSAYFNQAWTPLSGTISGHAITGPFEFSGANTTAIWQDITGGGLYLGWGNNSDLSSATQYSRIQFAQYLLSADVINNDGNISQFYADGAITQFGGFKPTGESIYIKADIGSTMASLIADDGTTYGSITIDPSNIKIESKNGTVELHGGSSASTMSRLIMSPNSAIVRGGTSFPGLQEFADYSANYSSLSYINKGYADSRYAAVVSGGYLPLSGGTMSGNLILNADPISALQAATKQYVDAALTGLWDDRGAYDASGGAYPSSGGSGSGGAIMKGDIWTISVGGTLPTGQVVEQGDTVRALIDTPVNTQTNWAIAQNNIGYTPITNVLNSAQILVGNSSNIAMAVAMTGDVTIDNTGITSIGAGKVTNSMLAGSIDLTSKVTGILPSANGGTGINNGSSTITIGGNVTFSGAYTFTGTLTSNTSVTFPTSGTLITNSYYNTSQTLIDAAIITWDVSLGRNAKVTLGGNRTLGTPTNVSAGEYYTLQIIQDGTGSRTLTLPSTWKVVNGGAHVISLTTTAGAIDIITIYYDGANYFVTYGLNFTS